MRIHEGVCSSSLHCSHSTTWRLRLCKNNNKGLQSSVVCWKEKKQCLIWNTSEIRTTVYVPICLWKINSVGEESNYQEHHSVKTCFFRVSFHSLTQKRISRLCRSNKGPLGGSGSYDEDRLKLVSRKLRKTDSIWSIIIFCIYWEGPCLPLNSLPPLVGL